MLLDWLDGRKSVVPQMLDLGSGSNVTFHRSTRVLNLDTRKMRPEQQERLNTMLTLHEVNSTPSMFRFDSSRFGDGDYLGGREHASEFVEIFGEEPAQDRVNAGKRLSNKIGDWDALYEHWRRGFDLFVTTDVRAPFDTSRREKARDDLGLRIVSPDEAIAELRTLSPADGSVRVDADPASGKSR